jgi:nucleoside-diphosphate-sugar epimerase
MEMRIFVAGATGVLGTGLVPLLVCAGHDVTGMTRSSDKADRLRELGAEPIVCDVFDAEVLAASIEAAAPDVLIDELTDLPDTASELGAFRERNDRMRTEGSA